VAKGGCEEITDGREALLRFCDYPAAHWRHLRTTNPIESIFAAVRARTELTKGPGSRKAGLAINYKLLGKLLKGDGGS
jgi:putative transposase